MASAVRGKARCRARICALRSSISIRRARLGLGLRPRPPAPGTCAGAWETEPNESRASANALCADGTIKGTITSGSDADWYTFTVAPNQTYTATMTDLGPSFNLAVYKVTGPGEPAFISIGELSGATRSVVRTTTTGGTYFVWVYGLNGAGSPGTPYALSARAN